MMMWDMRPRTYPVPAVETPSYSMKKQQPVKPVMEIASEKNMPEKKKSNLDLFGDLGGKRIYLNLDLNRYLYLAKFKRFWRFVFHTTSSLHDVYVPRTRSMYAAGCSKCNTGNSEIIWCRVYYWPYCWCSSRSMHAHHVMERCTAEVCSIS